MSLKCAGAVELEKKAVIRLVKKLRRSLGISCDTDAFGLRLLES